MADKFDFSFPMFPLRQKILIGLTALVGLILTVCSIFDLLSHHFLNRFVLFYGMGVPFFLLALDTIIDLNNKTIYLTWLSMSTILLIISFITSNSARFVIERSSTFDENSGFNGWLGDHSTSSLKALFIFLLFYWVFNKFLNTKGMFLVNTYGHKKWYHNEANRRITGLDVIINIILGVVIIAAGLFGY